MVAKSKPTPALPQNPADKWNRSSAALSKASKMFRNAKQKSNSTRRTAHDRLAEQAEDEALDRNFEDFKDF